MIRCGLVVSCAALVACGPIDPEVAAQRCEERAQAAQGPTGGITVGVNNKTGGFASAEIGISSDFVQGRDPIAVYESCVLQTTGEAPIRPPVLRAR